MHHSESYSDESTPSQVNRILAAHPAVEPLCGQKHVQVHLDGRRLVLDVSFTDCTHRNQIVVDLDMLDAGAMWTDVAPTHGRGQVIVPCRNDAPCARYMTREAGEEAWRLRREEPALAVDCAADPEVVVRLRETLARLLAEAAGPDARA